MAEFSLLYQQYDYHTGGSVRTDKSHVEVITCIYNESWLASTLQLFICAIGTGGHAHMLILHPQSCKSFLGGANHSHFSAEHINYEQLDDFFFAPTSVACGHALEAGVIKFKMAD